MGSVVNVSNLITVRICSVLILLCRYVLPPTLRGIRCTRGIGAWRKRRTPTDSLVPIYDAHAHSLELHTHGGVECMSRPSRSDAACAVTTVTDLYMLCTHVVPIRYLCDTSPLCTLRGELANLKRFSMTVIIALSLEYIVTDVKNRPLHIRHDVHCLVVSRCTTNFSHLPSPKTCTEHTCASWGPT